MRRGFSLIAPIILLFGLLIVVILVTSFLGHRGYGGMPSGYSVEGKILPYLVFKYDRSSEKLEEIYKIKTPSVSSAVEGGFLYYGERGSITGLKPPQVNIYNVLEEKKEAEIVGRGLGPNPVKSLIGIGLTWLTFPFILIFGRFLSILNFNL